MSDDDQGDEQDTAEAFDETHREGEDPNLFDAEDAFDPDLDDRAYDVTRARGDDEDDEDLDDDLTAASDEDLAGVDIEEDEIDDEENAQGGEGLEADEPDGQGLPRSGVRLRMPTGADEPPLILADDLDDVAEPRNRQSDKFESNGPLSDEQIRDLGYGPRGRAFASPADHEHEDERLDEALEESFPASDPPAVNRTT